MQVSTDHELTIIILQGHRVHQRCMIPTPAMVVGVAVVVGMRGGTRQQLSQGQGSTRREVKGHTPTPPTMATTVRGEEEEDGEMGESAVF